MDGGGEERERRGIGEQESALDAEGEESSVMTHETKKNKKVSMFLCVKCGRVVLHFNSSCHFCSEIFVAILAESNGTCKILSEISLRSVVCQSRRSSTGRAAAAVARWDRLRIGRSVLLHWIHISVFATAIEELQTTVVQRFGCDDSLLQTMQPSGRDKSFLRT